MKENYKTIKCFVECETFVVYWVNIEKQWWDRTTDESTLLTCLLIVNDNTRRQPARKRYKFIGNEIKL